MVPGQSWNWHVHNDGCGDIPSGSMPLFHIPLCIPVSTVQHGDSAIITVREDVYVGEKEKLGCMNCVQ